MAARQIAIGTVVGVGIGGAATFFYLRQQQRAVRPVGEGGGSASGLAGVAQHPALKHGMPVGDRLRLYTDFLLSFDTRLRNPRWVLEHISRDKLRSRQGSRQNSQFAEDSGIERRFRSKLDDYRGSGFDRGHMAPASNHKTTQGTMDETFTLSNTSPQVGPGFNRDYWARLERFVQDLATSCDDVWVVTGPLYLPVSAPPGAAPAAAGYVMQHPMLGTPPQLMAVPTHFFKVVLGEFGGGSRAAAGAFVLPNAPIASGVPLASFAVPIGALEEVSGLRFFPGYLSDQRREALDETALAVQSIGYSQLRLLQPGHTPPLLPAPAGAVPAPLPGAAGVPAAAPATDQRRSLGALHICEHTECRLPAERFWESNGGSSKGGSGGKGSGGGAGLRRTASVP